MNLDPYYDKGWKQRNKLTKQNVISTVAILLIGLSFFIAHSIVKREPAPVMKKSHSEILPTTRQIVLSEYFRRKGSPTPNQMAEAVLATSQPRLMASIAIRESHGNPKAVGDGGKSRGAFQCQPRHWKHLMYEKKVSNDPVIQALDSERILEALVAENDGNLKKGLNAYNGDKTKRTYAQNILAELENVP